MSDTTQKGNSKRKFEEVFPPDQITALGLEYKERMVKTLNKTGYMRNYLCEISYAFCTQRFSDRSVLLEVGSGIGAVLNTLMLNGARHMYGVDAEQGHLDLALKLLKPTLDRYPEAKLTVVCDTLPDLKSLGRISVDSILCAQVLHYAAPDQFGQAIRRLRDLLKPGGTLFITVGSPYIEVYRGFAEEYQRRRVEGDRFPGFMEDVRKYHPSGATHNPGFFLFFDPEILAARVSELGFKVYDSFLMDAGGKPRAQTGLVAGKI